MSPTDYFAKPAVGQSPAWSLADIYADLVTREEVAQGLDVRMPRLMAWIRDHSSCPKPIKQAGPVYLYSMEEWRVWFDRWLLAHPNNKRVHGGKPHSDGQSFWSYFQDVDNGDT